MGTNLCGFKKTGECKHIVGTLCKKGVVITVSETSKLARVGNKSGLFHGLAIFQECALEEKVCTHDGCPCIQKFLNARFDRAICIVKGRLACIVKPNNCLAFPFLGVKPSNGEFLCISFVANDTCHFNILTFIFFIIENPIGITSLYIGSANNDFNRFANTIAKRCSRRSAGLQ